MVERERKVGPLWDRGSHTTSLHGIVKIVDRWVVCFDGAVRDMLECGGGVNQQVSVGLGGGG